MPQQQHNAAAHAQLRFSWPLAPQPDIVRAAQKDALYLDDVLAALQDAAARVLGPVPAMAFAREARLVAAALYYLLTTGLGAQTLGEEYCDVIQLYGAPPPPVAAAAASAASAAAIDARGPVPAPARVALALLQAAAPYASERAAAAFGRFADADGGGGGDAGWGDGFGGRGGGGGSDDGECCSSGEEEGGDAAAAAAAASTSAPTDWIGAVRAWWARQQRWQGQPGQGQLQQQLQQHHHHQRGRGGRSRRGRRQRLLGPIAALRQSAPARAAAAALRRRWPELSAAGALAARAHLALFYLTGAYYHWEKRVVGVTHASVAPHVASRASYRALGWMLVAQLAAAAAAQAGPLVRAVVGGDSGSGGDSSSGNNGAAAALPSQRGQHAVVLPDAVCRGRPCESGGGGGGRGDGSGGGGGGGPTLAQLAGGGGGGANGGGNTCPLCLSRRSNPACAPCGHVFCWHCIARWAAEKPECPMCRAGVVPSRLVCVYGSDI